MAGKDNNTAATPDLLHNKLFKAAEQQQHTNAALTEQLTFSRRSEELTFSIYCEQFDSWSRLEASCL